MRKIMVILLLILLAFGSLPAQQKPEPAAKPTQTHQPQKTTEPKKANQTDCDKLREQVRELKAKLWRQRHQHRTSVHSRHHRQHKAVKKHHALRLRTKPAAKPAVRAIRAAKHHFKHVTKHAKHVRRHAKKKSHQPQSPAAVTQPTPPPSTDGVVSPSPSPSPEVLIGVDNTILEQSKSEGPEGNNWQYVKDLLFGIAMGMETGHWDHIPTMSEKGKYTLFWILVLGVIATLLALALRWWNRRDRSGDRTSIIPDDDGDESSSNHNSGPWRYGTPSSDDFDPTETIDVPARTVREDENEEPTLVRRSSSGTPVRRGPRKPIED